MQKTDIQWSNMVWNPVTGCDKISQGCKFCYAETIAKRFWKDRKFTDVIMHPERLQQISRLRKPKMIFVNSMSDLFHDKVKTGFIIDIFDAIANNDQHIYQILTKRPQRMKELIREYMNWVTEQQNIWLGVSVENQKYADERIPLLLQTPAKVRWVSIEPLLGEIFLPNWLEDKELGLLNWVVVGCESGPKKRECKIEWVESIVEQCKAAKVPVFVKQLQINGKVERDINNFPKHLQIQEYPNVSNEN